MKLLGVDELNIFLKKTDTPAFLKDNDLLVSSSLSELFNACDERVFKIVLAIFSAQERDTAHRLSYEVAHLIATSYLPADRFVPQVTSFLSQNLERPYLSLWVYLARSPSTNKRFLLNGLKNLLNQKAFETAKIFEISVHSVTDDLLETELVHLAPFSYYFYDDGSIDQIKVWNKLSPIYFLRVASDSFLSPDEFNEMVFFSKVQPFDVWYTYAEPNIQKQIEALQENRKRLKSYV